MKFAFRPLLLQIHRWSGLTVGLVICLMGITGAAIVFRPALEPVVNHDLLTVPACMTRVPLDVLAANAAAVRPTAKLDYVRIVAGEPGELRMPAAMVRFTDEVFVYLNPCTGEVVGQRARYGGVLGTIEQIHRFRFMKHGSLITGTSTIFFGLVLVIGGLVLWWPRTGSGWRYAFALRAGRPARVSAFRLHRVAGVCASAVLLAQVFTGLPWAFDWYAHGIYTVTGSPRPKKPKSLVPANGAARLSLETFWRTAQERVPDPQDALLHIPDKPREPIEMYLIARDAPHPNARTMLFIDAYTGKVLRFVPYEQSSVGFRLYFWMLSWHTGQYGGVLAQLLLLLGALTVPVLGYTGIRNFVRRTRGPVPSDARLEVRVAAKTVEADGVCAFELVGQKGEKLPSFTAGSHIDVYVGGFVRQYSLCGDSRDRRRYLIAVLCAPESRGASVAMHERVEVGDLLEIGVPRNHFALDESAPGSLLLAGGIGITPILGMAERLAQRGADFEMHYCARSRSRAAFLERLARSSFARRVTYHFSDECSGTRLDIDHVVERQPAGTHLYVCGPERFTDAVLDAARRHGWTEERLHSERFAAQAKQPAMTHAFDVRVLSTGKMYRVAEHMSITTALAGHDIEIPMSCEQGICGTCVTRVVSGEVEHLDSVLTEVQRENGYFTPCCSRAKGECLVLDI
ncbi:flavodoxin reductase [Burkholderia sp. Bp9031]|uniref:PepSY domain-containing protein n=1 Tax=Burkholderia sp. Bp9031 TaxID=2184566 RepID=UPI000F5E1E7C|nr:PepSY domain-containing protein [Burkholderia sp. Bp9031]RQZ10224.1 flavodoxin reductase [Burkholderia sp. Bp9031]